MAFPGYCSENVDEIIVKNEGDAVSGEQSIEQIDTQVEEIQKEIDTISNCINPKIAEALESYLVGTIYDESIHLFGKGGLYDESANPSGNLTDWNVLVLSFDNDDPEYDSFDILSGSSLSCEGDQTDIFWTSLANAPSIAFATTNSESEIVDIVYGYIESATYDTTTGETIVVLTYPCLTSGQTLCFTIEATYNDPHDGNVDEFVNDWNVGHDYIHSPIDNTKTYGLEAKKSMLQTAKTMITNNVSKFTTSVTSWSKYLSGGFPMY